MMQIKLLNQNNKKAVIEFTNHYSNKKRTQSEWNWEFESFNISPQVFSIGEQNGEIIGTQAALPIPLRRNNQTVVSAKSEETLVRPDFRGNNVFALMYDQVFKNANHDGIQLIWGFTGAKKPFSKIGFQVFNNGLNNYIFVTSIARIIRQYSTQTREQGIRGIIKRLFLISMFIFIKVMNVFDFGLSSKSDGYKTVFIDEFSQETDKLQIDVSEQIPDLITIERNESYMRWRISHNPYYYHQVLGLYLENNLVGYAVLARLDNSLEMIIVDMLIKPDHLKCGIEVLVRDIKKMAAKDKNLGYISFLLMPCLNNYTAQMLKGIKSAGFFKSIGTMPFIIKILNDDIRNTYTDVNKWYINGLMTEGVARRI